MCGPQDALLLSLPLAASSSSPRSVVPFCFFKVVFFKDIGVCSMAIDLGGGKEKKFHAYPQNLMLWSNIRLFI